VQAKAAKLLEKAAIAKAWGWYNANRCEAEEHSGDDRYLGRWVQYVMLLSRIITHFTLWFNTSRCFRESLLTSFLYSFVPTWEATYSEVFCSLRTSKCFGLYVLRSVLFSSFCTFLISNRTLTYTTRTCTNTRYNSTHNSIVQR
jgi:hypothetical protein